MGNQEKRVKSNFPVSQQACNMSLLCARNDQAYELQQVEEISWGLFINFWFLMMYFVVSSELSSKEPIKYANFTKLEIELMLKCC